MKHNKFVRLALTTAVLGALTPFAWAGSAYATGPASDQPSAAPMSAAAAGAQDASTAAGSPAQSKTPPASSKPHTLETVVVTGNVTPGGIKQLDAAYATNTLSPQQIHNLAIHGTADLMRTVPGMWVESSGGATGANVYVAGFPGAGDAHFVNTELNGNPLYGAYGLSFMSSPDLLRYDESIKQVQTVQNGPNDIFGAGRPGATVNFIQKTGLSTPEGSGIARMSIGPLGYQRIGGYWAGKIAPNWYLGVGGFVRRGDGVHQASFPVNKGGQLEAVLTHVFDNDNGKINFSVRHTNDDNMFLTDSPVRVVGGHIFPLDQFDARKDTLLSQDMRHMTLQVAPGMPPATISRDLAEGRGARLSVFGSKLSWDLGSGWHVSNNAGYTYGTILSNALFNNTAPPQTMGSFIDQSIDSVNSDPAIMAITGRATAGTATFAGNGQMVPMGASVLQTGFWTVEKHIRSFTDNLNISKKLFSGNTATFGVYYATYGDKDFWDLGNNLLSTLQNNGRLIDLALNNGAVISANGISGPSTDMFAEHWKGRNAAAYFADTWFVGRWILDGGIRVENQRDTGFAEGDTTADLDGDPLTVYNNDAKVFDGKYTPYTQDQTHVAWSFGANYGITTSMSAYVRVSNGQLFPMFDDIQGGTPDVQTVRQYEVGFKSIGKYYDANVSIFYNHFHHLSFEALAEVDGQLINFNEAGSTAAKGVEAEVTVHPTQKFSVNFDGDYLDGHYETFGSASGNQLQRQPRLQFRITPTYTVPVSWGTLSAFVRYTHVGNRFGDIANDQRLPAYNTTGAGVSTTIGKRWDVSLVGRNLTNTLGLTEGNVRALFGVNGGGGVIFGRSIFGRTYRLSATYHF